MNPFTYLIMYPRNASA